MTIAEIKTKIAIAMFMNIARFHFILGLPFVAAAPRTRFIKTNIR